MKKNLIIILLLSSIISFGQELTTIKISVPNETDEVFIVGNQDSFGNWQPDKVKMNRISDYEREISLNLTFPAEFKFTRGTWESEAIITKLTGEPNFVLSEKPSTKLFYKIQGWTDQIDKFSTFSDFKISEIKSNFLKQNRKVYISLPENYNKNINYPVIYVTDANILNIFEIVVQTLRQQSNFSNFPECIVVGIYINIRERNNELDIEYGENGKKFKDYIFKEVIPFIENNYSTSEFKAIYGHSNGAEYNHHLMFETDNPFDAFMNISENLIELENGKFEIIKNKYIKFLSNNRKPIKYFVASAKYDDPNRYPSGIEIEKVIVNNPNKNVDFQQKVYKSWHVDLIGYSILDAFQFVFSDYQDYSLFEKGVNSNNFNYKEVKEKYLKQNEKYIQPYIENDASSVVVGEIIRKTGKSKVLNQYLDYEDENNEIYNLYVRAILFYEINDLETALYYLDKMVKENDQNSIQQLINSNAVSYIEIYKKANKLEIGYKNLDILKKNNPELEKEINLIKQKIK
ncbi:alpha/beta hydrolase-fold protein [Psychroflexus sp. MBR-150]|jgi:predicted alpha/beta superfamily hydrolase